MGSGRSVFPDEKNGPIILFEGVSTAEPVGHFYIVADGKFHLPVEMVKSSFDPGKFFLVPECSVMALTVLNRGNQECVMIKRNGEGGNVSEVLIPLKIIYKLVQPSRETYPSKFD